MFLLPADRCIPDFFRAGPRLLLAEDLNSDLSRRTGNVCDTFTSVLHLVALAKAMELCPSLGTGSTGTKFARQPPGVTQCLCVVLGSLKDRMQGFGAVGLPVFTVGQALCWTSEM